MSKRRVVWVASVAVVMIAARATGWVGWSWWLVLVPVWVPPVFMITLATIYAIINEGASHDV